MEKVPVELPFGIQSSYSSRNFLNKNYWDLKKLNPMFPFLIRESKDTDPYLIVGFGIPHFFSSLDVGREEVVDLKGKSEDEIETLLKQVVLKGATVERSQIQIRWDDIRTEERTYKNQHHLMELITTPTDIRPERLIFGPMENDDYTGPSNLDTLDEDMQKAGLQ